MDPVADLKLFGQHRGERTAGGPAIDDGQGDLFRKIAKGLKKVEQPLFPVFGVADEDQDLGFLEMPGMGANSSLSKPL